MGKTLIVPLQLAFDGSLATTEDPVVITKQRIIDLLVTSRFDRIHRLLYGCDLAGFLFTNVIEHVLAAKALEIKQLINSTLSFGEATQVLMTPLMSAGHSAVQIDVLFRVYQGGEAILVSETVLGLPEQEAS